MNFINVNPVQVGNTPTSNANFIGVVYSNVLKSSLSYYLPLVGGVLSSNLSIGNSTNNSNTLNVHSFINVASNITVCSNVITSNINSINQNNSGLITTASLISGETTLTNTITQTNKRLITLKGLISIESNISFNLNLDTLSPPIANASLMGGSGSRIIFKNAKNISAYPDAIGLDTDTLWMSSSNISIFINGENKVNINSNGVLTTSNQINQINQNVNNFFMGKVGIATSVSSEYNLNVNGSINASSITINGSSISGSISDVITNNSNFTSGTGFNTSNYATNISNILKANIDTNLANNSNFTSGTGFNTSNYARNISNVLKDNIDTKEAILTFSNPLTRTTNTIGINLASYSTTGTDTNYLLKTGGAMTGQITGVTTLNATTIISSTLSTTNNGNILGPTKGVNGSTGDRFILWVGDANTYPYSLGIDNSTLWYSVPNGSSHKFYHNGLLITTISSTGLSTTGTINASTNLQENGTNLTSKYLQLGGGTMTGQLQLTTATGNNSLLIYSSVTNAINNIELKNNLSKSCYIGIGAGGYNGNYMDTLFIQSPTALILNTNANGTTATPNFIINISGNVGIGTTNPTCKLSLGSSSGYKVLSLWDNATPNNFQFVGFGNNGGLCFNTNISTDAFQFRVGSNTTSAKELMRISGTGYVGINTTDPKCHLQVNGIGSINNGSDHSITNGRMQSGSLTIGGTNADYGTEINWSGNTAGLMMECSNCTEIVIHDAGNRLASFMYYDGPNNTFNIGRLKGPPEWGKANTIIHGILTTSSNIDCGGGIAINGANAFYSGVGIGSSVNAVDTNNATNTYINFKENGTQNDWCYVRQIGVANAFKLAFDFHDDDEARFCIRSVKSANSSTDDNVNEVFLVDNGNVTAKGTINASINLQEAGTNLTSKYLQLSGGTMTGQLIFTTTTGNNPIRIYSTSTAANNCIQFENNNSKIVYLGLGGSEISGANYKNNFFIQSTNGIILNVNRGSVETPNFIINNSGNVGIGTTNPVNILQVGDGGKLRIANGITDYSLLGSKDVDDYTNTRIVVSANGRGSGYAGCIEYVSTSNGDHIFYATSNIRNDIKMIIKNSGNVGIGITNPYSLLHIKGTDTITALTIMGKGTGGAKSQLNLSTHDTVTNLPNCSLVATDTGNYGATFEIKQKTDGANANAQFTSLFIDKDGYVGIGTNVPVSKLNLYDTIQSKARLILSGQEFYQPSNTSAEGIAFLIGVNRTDNRQLWIGESSKLTQNTTNAILRLMPINSAVGIDAVATNGTTALPINIGGSVVNLNANTYISGNVGIGVTNPSCRLQLKTEAVPKQICLYEGASINNYNFLGFGNGGGMILQLNSITYDSFIFNVANAESDATGNNELMRIKGNGNIGIGTNNPLHKLHINGALHLTDNPSNPGNNTSASFWNQGGVGATISAFAIAFQTNGTTECMRITNNGNVGIGTNTEYSTATKLNIKGSSSGYSQPLVRIEQTATWDGGVNNYALQVVGYSDLGGIRINGGDLVNSISKTAATGDMGLTVNNGNMLFGVNGAERMRIDSNGLIKTSGSIDCGGGIAISGSNAFYAPAGISDTVVNAVDTSNAINTYINFKYAGANSDWCYLRQIGGDNAFKLAFDFHDDDEARFCIRSVRSANSTTTDTVKEVFTVDNGNVTATGTINAAGGTMTGQLKFTTTSGDHSIYINSTVATSFNCIHFKNNSITPGYNGYIGLGGTSIVGNYKNNVFIEANNALILNVNRVSESTPNFIINNSGNVGIGTTNPLSLLHIEHTSTNFNAEYGGLYVFNPNNIAGNVSVLGARIGGTLASKAGISLDVSGGYGWSIYIKGSDTTDRYLRFNKTWSAIDDTATEKMDFLKIHGITGDTYMTGICTAKGLVVSDNVGIGITNPFAPLCIGSPVVASDGVLVLSKNGNAGNRNFKMGYDASFNFCFGDFGSALSGNTWRSTDLTFGWSTGNIGIGVVPHATYKLDVNGSLNASTINQAGVEIDSRYLKLSGGTMTGQLILTTTTGDNPIRIYSTSTTVNNCIQFENDNSKLAYIGLGGSAIPGANYKNNFFIQSTNGIILNVDRGSDSTPNFIINSSGNVGIGTTNPIAKLHIFEESGSIASVNTGSIILQHNNSGGASSITFRSKNNITSDFGYIQYRDDTTVDGTGESAKLIIGTQNDADDDILLLPSGGVAINTTTTSGYKLYVNGTTYLNGDVTATKFIGRLQGKADTADTANALNSGNDYTVNTINANGNLLYKGHRQPLTIRYYIVSNGVDNSGYWINYKGYSNVYIKIMILGRYGEYAATDIPTNVPYAPANVLNISNIEWYLWYFTPDSVGGQTKFWYGRMAAGTKIYVEEMWY